TGDHFAVDQHRYAVGEVEYHAHVVFHHHQGLAHGHITDQFHRLAGFAATHSRGGFVQQDHVGSTRYGHADLQRPLLGVGQHASRPVPAHLHADALDDFVRPVTHFPERAD